MLSEWRREEERTHRSTATDICPMLTIKQVSQLMHVHPNTVRRWTEEGMITAYRITPRGDRRFREDDVSRFLVRFRLNGGDPREAASRVAIRQAVA